MAATVMSVEPGSYAEKHGIYPGCALLKINGHEIVDVLDYRFYMMEDTLKVSFKTPEGQIKLTKIEKDDEYDDLGIEFETYLIDKQHSCNNKCIFCFVDQLPKGMRDSLYFKDDDSRMSFFYGNYITLTNLSDEDIDRIIEMHISPVNVSVHTMNPKLRCMMMNNRFAGDSLRYLYKLAEAGISINTQLVLCPGINDGDELVYSINELYKLYPSVQSVACVPVGLTKHREGLYELEPYTRYKAKKVIETIDNLSERFKAETGKRFCYAADEFYLTAELPIPEEEYYDGYPQLDNGVGLLRLFETDVYDALSEEAPVFLENKVIFSLVTGKAAESFIRSMSCAIETLFGRKLQVNVYGIENVFFGHDVTVTGLLTGEDIIRQLKGKDLGSILLLPKVLLRSGETVLLDDVTVEDIERELGVPVCIIDNDGYEFTKTIISKAKEA